MNKKNIVYFIGQIGLGGSEKQLYLLLKYLNRPDLVCYVVVFNNSPFGNYEVELSKIGVKLYFIPKNVNSIPKRFIYLFYLLKKINPILIHSWTIHDNAYAGILGSLLKIKSLGSLRGSIFGTGFSKLSKFYKQIALRSVDNLLVNAKTLKLEAIDYGIPKSKIKYIPNSVEISTEKNINERELIVCSIGNLRKNKNHSLFIDIMSNVLESIPSARGWIIGQPVQDEPDVENELQSKIEVLELQGRVQLLGFQPDILNLLRKCSVLVLTSISEGMPNVVLEAMSIGIPVVASNVGGVTQLISHEESGLLCNIKNKNEFVDSIIKLLKQTDYNSKLGKCGMKFVVASHSPEKNVDNFNSLYFDLLGI